LIINAISKSGLFSRNPQEMKIVLSGKIAAQPSGPAENPQQSRNF